MRSKTKDVDILRFLFFQTKWRGRLIAAAGSVKPGFAVEFWALCRVKKLCSELKGDVSTDQDRRPGDSRMKPRISLFP